MYNHRKRGRRLFCVCDCYFVLDHGEMQRVRESDSDCFWFACLGKYFQFVFQTPEKFMQTRHMEFN